MSTMKTDDRIDPSSNEAVGKRIRYIREQLIDKSRSRFAELHKNKNITKDSLQNWEENRFGGLKLKMVENLLQAFDEEGIDCSKTWLLDGTGEPPKKRTLLDQIMGGHFSNRKSFFQEKAEEERIAIELRAFRECNIDAMDAIIGDEALTPCFLPGDYVAGVRYIGADIEQAISLACIIQTQSGQVLTRKLEMGTEAGCYNLVSSKPSQDKLYKLTNVKIFSAAPIIWWRRPFSLIKR